MDTINKEKAYMSFYPNLSTILLIYMILINNEKSSILSLIAILISLIFIFNPKYILPPLFFVSILGEYFVAFNGIGMSRILVTIFIVGSLIKFMKSNIKFKSIYFILIMAICIFNFISAATSITGTITPAITMALNFIMLFFMVYTKLDDLEAFINTMKNGVVILSVYIFTLGISIYSRAINDNSISRMVIDEGLNPNEMGIALAQLSAFLFALLLLSKNIKELWFLSLILILNLISLFLTGSRSAAIGIVIAIIVVTFIGLFKKEKVTKKLLVFGVTVIILITSYLSISNSELEVFQRFSIENVVESDGTGRTLIWSALIKEVIPENLLFGVGFGGSNVYAAVQPHVPIAHGTHNMILTIITQVGIIGSAIYLLIFYRSSKTLYKGYLKNDFVLIPLTMVLTSFANGIGEDIFSERFLWFAIGFGFMLITNYKSSITLKK